MVNDTRLTSLLYVFLAFTMHKTQLLLLLTEELSLWKRFSELIVHSHGLSNINLAPILSCSFHVCRGSKPFLSINKKSRQSNEIYHYFFCLLSLTFGIKK